MRWCAEDLGLSLRWHAYARSFSSAGGMVAFPLAAMQGNLTSGKKAIVVIWRKHCSRLVEDGGWARTGDDHPRKLRLLVGNGPSSNSVS